MLRGVCYRPRRRGRCVWVCEGGRDVGEIWRKDMGQIGGKMVGDGADDLEVLRLDGSREQKVGC